MKPLANYKVIWHLISKWKFRGRCQQPQTVSSSTIGVETVLRLVQQNLYYILILMLFPSTFSCTILQNVDGNKVVIGAVQLTWNTTSYRLCCWCCPSLSSDSTRTAPWRSCSWWPPCRGSRCLDSAGGFRSPPGSPSQKSARKEGNDGFLFCFQRRFVSRGSA